jgi:hypothetical protein
MLMRVPMLVHAIVSMVMSMVMRMPVIVGVPVGPVRRRRGLSGPVGREGECSYGLGHAVVDKVYK